MKNKIIKIIIKTTFIIINTIVFSYINANYGTKELILTGVFTVYIICFCWFYWNWIKKG